MKIRRKPSKPKRKTRRQYVDVWNYETLADLIAKAGVSPETIYLDSNYDGVELYWNEPEDAESYAKRLAQYERKLADYQAWYADNRKEIEAELEKRKNAKYAEVQKQVEKLEKQKERLLKQLEEKDD